jgi:hypothetical protein
MRPEPSLPKYTVVSRAAAPRLLITTLIFLAVGTRGFAYQASTWRHESSEHFTVSYDRRTEALVGLALRIAEDTREALVAFFGEFPADRRISIVLSDAVDEPNGWSSERDYLVHVDCRKSQGLLRGDADWLRTALTHELSHAYSLAMLRAPVVLRLGAGISSSVENGRASASYAIGDPRVPVWFIEGLAQMGSDSVGADSRDPVREMVLRDAALSGRLLDLKAMARFEGSSLEYELAYNQGYALLKYLQAARPDAPLAGLCARVKAIGFAAAVRELYGESVESLYSAWREELLSSLPEASEARTGTALFDRKGPYVLETACAADGAYVVANWGSDYERLGVFAKGRGGVYRKIADYAGRALKRDRLTGEIWFAKSVYDARSGVDNYDLYSLAPGGKPARATKGARCLAFDAIGGQLIYARYSKGTTSLVSRGPGGAETVLAELPYGFSVESVSAVTGGTALLSVGTPEGPRAAIVADGGLRYLWPGRDALDLSFGGEDRVVFSSSIEGSPQIYWADLAADPSTWYRVTDAPAGSRFPSVESGESGDVLYFSAYENGGYRLHRLEDPFAKDRALAIEGEPAADPEPVPALESYPGSIAAASNTVVDFWPISIGIDIQRGRWSTSYSPYAGLGFSVFDAPGDLGLDCSLAAAFTTDEGQPNPAQVALDARGGFALGTVRAELGYSLGLQSAFSYGWLRKYASHSLSAAAAWQLASNQSIGLDCAFDSYLDSTFSPSTAYFDRLSAGVSWSLADSPRSRFDPADLGGDGYIIAIEAHADYLAKVDPLYYSWSGGYTSDPRLVCRLNGEAGLNGLLAGGKVGIGASVFGLGVLNGTDGTHRSPNEFPAIGGSGSFGGYPERYATVSALAKATLEIAVNPFVDGRAATRAVERASLSLALEAGCVRYFTTYLQEIGFPLSIEARLRHRFYQSPSRRSEVFAAVAVPLNDFMESLDDQPFRIYAGYSY